MKKYTQVKIKRHADLVLPEYATEGSVAFDLIATGLRKVYSGQKELDMKLFEYAIEQGHFILRAHERALIGTGLFIELPRGKELQVRPRSGLALKRGLTVINSPGTIDSDYRGEVCIILVNTTDQIARINFGDAVAQGVIADVDRCYWTVVDELTPTDRGDGGFGHTNFWKPERTGVINLLAEDAMFEEHEVVAGTYLVRGKYAINFPLSYTFVGTKPYDGRRVNRITISNDKTITNEYVK